MQVLFVSKGNERLFLPRLFTCTLAGEPVSVTSERQHCLLRLLHLGVMDRNMVSCFHVVLL